MRIADPPVNLFPHGGALAGNTGTIAPLRPPRASTERHAGGDQLPQEHVRIGELLPRNAIPNDWAASARFVGGRAGAVYDRSGNAVQLVDRSPAISAYLSHSQTDHAAAKVGTLVNAFV